MTECVQTLLTIACEKLKNNSDTAILDAEILLAHVLKKGRSFLYAYPLTQVDDVLAQQFFSLVTRRIKQEPVAYLTGQKEFWSLPLRVTPDVLVPRPETELLVEFALQQLPQNMFQTVADLGTGSGAIALAIASERLAWEITAVDVSPAALQLAKWNALDLHLNQVIFLESHWCAALKKNYFDMLISNPPYIADEEWPQYAKGLQFEPEAALRAANAGLKDIAEIICQAPQYLKPNGWLVIEHGASQGEAVRRLFSSANFIEITTHYDLNGNERFTTARKPQ